MNKNAVLLGTIGAVAVVVLGLFVFLGSEDSTVNVGDREQEIQAPTTNSAGSQGTALAGSPEANENDTDTNGEENELSGALNYTINMKNFEFSSAQITASPGDTVTVNLTNSGGTHDFVIDELNVQSAVINSGEETSVTFTVPSDATGSYSYYCSIGNHRALGMEGTLVIN